MRGRVLPEREVRATMPRQSKALQVARHLNLESMDVVSSHH